MATETVIKSISDICVAKEQKGSVTLFHCQVNDDFYGFQGHFENQPIMPGVCQLKLVAEAVEILSQTPSICRIDRMKFHNLITPGTVFTVELEPTKGAWRYRIFNDSSDFASGKIILR